MNQPHHMYGADHTDYKPPQGPSSLTNLSEEQRSSLLTRQMRRWRTHGLDDEWYELLRWWVAARKDEFDYWRHTYRWHDTYWPAGGELDYAAWFQAARWPDREIYFLLDVALDARRRAEQHPAEGPPVDYLTQPAHGAGHAAISSDTRQSVANKYLVGGDDTSNFRYTPPMLL